jgi:hypothetical protein
MSSMNWSTPADLYSSTALRPRGSRYKRFPSAAEAVRFAVEELPMTALRSTAIESDDERHEGDAIRVLYYSPDYPLRRQSR